MKNEPLFIQVNKEETLHLKRWHCAPEGCPVLMIHGSIENGKIFYSSSGKGFAPWLAQQGFDVFVADLRGRGLSTPAISKSSVYGLEEILREDFPAYLNKIKELRGDVPQHWVAHSWGGVLMLAYIARHPEILPSVSSITFFGTKRRISIFNLKKLWMVNFWWTYASKIMIAIKGYLPAKEMKIGSDNETSRSHSETDAWVKNKRWLDWHNGFDYEAALKKLDLPPILSITGAGDNVLGHPSDVLDLLKESGSKNYKFRIIGKENGNLHNYDHINLLTHPDAVTDHFPIVADWMRRIVTFNTK